MLEVRSHHVDASPHTTRAITHLDRILSYTHHLPSPPFKVFTIASLN